jgi:anti-sigma B factor antagonist
MAVLNFDTKSVTLPSGEEAKSVFLTGSIDASTNQLFETELANLLSSGTNKILLVLTNIKYINSTGLGTIVKCVDNFREHDGDIKLVGVPTKVIALFEMLGLLALFDTFDSIEEAVASFGVAEAAADEPDEPAAPVVQFPIQFKHPVSGMGLNVAQPGRFKDPRSGDYFNITTEGKVEFYQISKASIVDIKLPLDAQFAPGLKALAEGLANRIGMSEEESMGVGMAIDELCSLMGDAKESVSVLMVGDKEKFQVGLVTYGKALALPSDAPQLNVIKASVDEVKTQVLPTKGNLLTLLKRR